MANDITGIMRKISALLASAESFEQQGNEAAAATYREKAETLLVQYRIEEEQLIADNGEIRPVQRDVDITYYRDEEFRRYHWDLWHVVARHCGIRSHNEWVSRPGEGFYGVAHVVGYDVDIRMAELIFMAARLAFIAKLSPKYDSTLPAEENIYRLRSAAIDRQTIAELVFGKKGHQEGIKVGQIYRAECEKRGEKDAVSGRGLNRRVYREAYADQFVTAISRRLRIARDAANSGAGAVVSVDRPKRVQEAFFAAFPEYDPKNRKEAESTNEALPKRKPPTKAQQEAFNRMYRSRSAIAAREAAEEAAKNVVLERAPHAGRVDSRKSSGAAGELEG